MALVSLLAATAVPLLGASLEAGRVRAAARYVAARLHAARMEAIKRGSHVGLRFDATTGYRYTAYVDGNGDGIRTQDITDNIDRPLAPSELLQDQFTGVAFGVLDGVTAIDAAEVLGEGADPVRVGSSDILSFGPLGTATAGTLYLRGRGREQCAVRVLGATGRIRVLRFDFAAGNWVLP